MLKRKYGNRLGWKRVTDRKYIQSFIDTEVFKGYVTLLKINKVTAPLFVQYDKEKVCIVDNGYVWVQHFPNNERYSLTTMFDASGEIVQWYIDICYQNGIENNVPWMDDLFLDIIVLPSGDVIQKDIEELEEALSKGVIDVFLYKMARDEANNILYLIQNRKFNVLKMAKDHKEFLLKMLK